MASSRRASVAAALPSPPLLVMTLLLLLALCCACLAPVEAVGTVAVPVQLFSVFSSTPVLRLGTFDVNVSLSAGATGTGPRPNGTVSFVRWGTALTGASGPCTNVVLQGGSAGGATSPEPGTGEPSVAQCLGVDADSSGSQPLTATYSGDDYYASASLWVSVDIEPTPVVMQAPALVPRALAPANLPRWAGMYSQVGVNATCLIPGLVDLPGACRNPKTGYSVYGTIAVYFNGTLSTYGTMRGGTVLIDTTSLPPGTTNITARSEGDFVNPFTMAASDVIGPGTLVTIRAPGSAPSSTELRNVSVLPFVISTQNQVLTLQVRTLDANGIPVTSGGQFFGCSGYIRRDVCACCKPAPHIYFLFSSMLFAHFCSVQLGTCTAGTTSKSAPSLFLPP
jgi:hypothetical protein